ncbi:calcium:cation antiporter [Xanthobacter sediminis]|uniref:calcium:proton antiporter n=1 Tax=Xanthobacter sediminis TaxID=3119926 RepID=UPI00372B9783
MTKTRFGAYAYVFPLLAVTLAAVLAAVPDFAPAHAAAGGSGVREAVGGALTMVFLCGSSFAAVAHADVAAARLGQPYGTLLLTFSVTLIEVSVLASFMLHANSNPTLVRESVFSVIMIVTTGIVGLCLLLGSLKHREQVIQQQGVTGFLSVLIALGVMLLILPIETRAGMKSGQFTPFQLGFMAFIAVALYAAFLYMQTVRYREHFVDDDSGHADRRPTLRRFAQAVAMLLVSLAGVVSLSGHVAASFEDFLGMFPLADPDAVTGALVATLLLLPEGISAVRAAGANHLQHSLNIALGSALASIALTIPAMAAISMVLGLPMELGLDPEDRTMMLLTFVLAILSFGTGRTNALNGVVHLILFGVYVMLTIVP